jgi:single-strand DNA-binding protein
MARDLNQIIIIGRLVRDPEIKYTTGGTPVTKFSIANNAGFTQGNEKKDVVNYFDVNVWGNQAENCSKYLKKGSQVAIDGHLRQNRWVDQTSGKTNSKVEIVANSVQFLTPSQRTDGTQTQYQHNNNQDNSQGNSQPHNTGNVANENKDFIPNPWSDNNNEINYDESYSQNGDKDDDIPF